MVAKSLILTNVYLQSTNAESRGENSLGLSSNAWLDCLNFTKYANNLNGANCKEHEMSLSEKILILLCIFVFPYDLSYSFRI